jgi:hypothetical protein
MLSSIASLRRPKRHFGVTWTAATGRRELSILRQKRLE